jgi:GNAT superfamily N-acetyltransferase
MTSACVIERACSEHYEPLVDLFGSADSPCFCQYHQFEGDARAWQDRCANARLANQDALREQLSQPGFFAMVALREQRVVGWARVCPASELSKRYTNRLYRGLPCFSGERGHVWSVVCFLVDPSFRRQGVSRALLQGAMELARGQGAEALEAFPRGATDVGDEQQWTGPVALYASAGFEKIHNFDPYPIFRVIL